MKEERMFILNMLNDGKISADDACKLLAAIKPSGEKSAEIGDKVGKYAKDLKTKVSKIAKDAEPKVKKYAEAVNDKFEDIKSNIKSKKASKAAEEEIIIVDTDEYSDEEGEADETTEEV